MQHALVHLIYSTVPHTLNVNLNVFSTQTAPTTSPASLNVVQTLVQVPVEIMLSVAQLTIKPNATVLQEWKETRESAALNV